MQLVPLDKEHLPIFFQQAAAEKWITSGAELDFLTSSNPSGCLTAIADGRPAGFITAIRYERSGWIGNLLVLPEFRGQGIGRKLIEEVIDDFERDGCETLWLTASQDGAPLYLTLGFLEIDSITRWKGFAQLPSGNLSKTSAASMIDLDMLGWGDSRRALFEQFCEERCYSASDTGFILATRMPDGIQIGPWSAADGITAVILFNKVRSLDGRSRCFLDTPDSNLAAAGILTHAGFSRCGSTLLMYRGKKPDYNGEQIYALASMGSYG